MLLILASQRIETELVETLMPTMPNLKRYVATDVTRRGSPPSLIEWLILAWVSGECFVAPHRVAHPRMGVW